MLNVLKVVFSIILVTMLVVTVRSAMLENILNIPAVVTGDPWFIATLFDAYCGFTTFYCWVYYKESGPIPRTIWFILIMLLGNITMSIYVLMQISKLPPGASAKDLLLRTPPSDMKS